jgi:hypothetical protein
MSGAPMRFNVQCFVLGAFTLWAIIIPFIRFVVAHLYRIVVHFSH